MPTRARYCDKFSSFPAMSLPSKTILPPVGSSSRFTQRSIVLLPEPDEPMMLITSPLFTEKLMSRST